MKRFLLALALLSPVALVNCGNATVTTPAPPNSAQTQVLHINNAFSDAIRLAITTSISLRDQGAISAADTRVVQDWLLKVLDVKDLINNELGSGDPWETQKQKILAYLVGFKLPLATSNQTLQATLTSVLTIIQQIRGQVQ